MGEPRAHDAVADADKGQAPAPLLATATLATPRLASASSSSPPSAAPAAEALRGVVRCGSSPGRAEAAWRRSRVQELTAPFFPLPRPPRGTSAADAAAGGAPASSSTAPASPLSPGADEGGSARLLQPPAGRAFHGLRTVELRDEERLHENFEASREAVGCWSAAWWHLQGWILAISIGVLSALSGQLIEQAVAVLSGLRFGWCEDQALAPRSSCSEGQWKYLGDDIESFGINVGLGAAFAAASGLMVYLFAPAASGSGIPEVKTILNGFVMPDVVSMRTLIIKVPGLALSVASGMALGKEGPLVHVAVCFAQLLSGVFLQFQNEAKRRELFSAAAAAGVSTAFGAPLGGVLFSLEEVSSTFPPKTLIRAFTAAVAAALTLSFLRRSENGLTMFSVEYHLASAPVEVIGFAALGVLGGLLGAAFNAANMRWSAIRRRPSFRRRIPAPLEVTLIAVVTLLSSWPSKFTRLLSADVIHALFEPCESASGNNHGQVREYLGLCTEEGYAEATAALLLQLAAAGILRLLQMTLTFGTQCPAGLFVPSLFVGGCLGRCFGVAMRALNEHHHFAAREIQPGAYAMVGAAAMLGGVCRVTISLVAIMLELTGSLTYLVPFMLAVLVAKIVGDAINEGIYDLHIVLKGYPFLQAEVNVTFDERCCDIMETRLTTLDVSLRPRMRDVRAVLQAYNYPGFPVVNDGHFIGYAKRRLLEAQLEHLATVAAKGDDDDVTLQDLMPCTDCTVMRMVPDASLSQAHKVFLQLGCKDIFLVGSVGHNPTQDVLQGILSKKRFLLALRSGRVGHAGSDGRDRAPGGAFLGVDGGAFSRQRSGGSTMPSVVEQYLRRRRLETISPRSGPASDPAAFFDSPLPSDGEDDEAARSDEEMPTSRAAAATASAGQVVTSLGEL